MRSVLLLALLASLQTVERIAAVQVQGNVLTSESEVLQLAGVAVGQTLEDGAVDRIATRLRETRRFTSVDVLKRYASIADPSQVALVIVVDEGSVEIVRDPTAPGGTRVRKRRGPPLMYWPILDYEDGYGFAYGLRTSIPNPVGARSRISLPLSWGADKRAAVEISKEAGHAAISRVEGGLSISERTNPYFDTDDNRRRASVRAERDFWKVIAGGGSAFERVSFLGDTDQLWRAGADVAIDTRTDPALARNAVYARAAWEHLSFDNHPSAWRSDLEARGYLGLPGQSVVVARAARQNSNRPLPSYLRPMLGGIPSVRGYGLGTDIGDTLVSGSLEWRMPVTSPLSVGKIGVSAFVDLGTLYDKGEEIQKQRFKQGVGGGLWFSAAMFRLDVMVGHGIGGSTRAHVQSSLLF